MSSPVRPTDGLTSRWGSRSFDPAQMRELAEAALGTARRSDDAELEASALALLSRALLLRGEFDAGVAALDEAMVAATGGEVTDPIVFGDVCCLVTLACEESGELEPLFKWNEVIETFMARHLHGPLLTHQMKDRLLPLKQPVLHPLDPRTTFLLRIPSSSYALAMAQFPRSNLFVLTGAMRSGSDMPRTSRRAPTRCATVRRI
jgi:hypothetical protein